ncbi:putative DNA ligase [Ralstonia phage RP12]|uniref:DNA ligase (NAD(+)) n=1 Tax=Ralstonia phage RP12 TaxID=1923889 RepID=A0A1L7N0Z0_9CAUD|nr:NAD-dependent DNA ligase [Ralstonia phage RP12]BAW19135.1 putative DNA ligase [Ralstonia phage RP12]
MINDYLSYVSLVSKMAEYHRAYHIDGTELIPDHEYDKLRKELIAWETKHPDKTLELSPTFKVGAIKASNKNEHLRHEFPMLSLENALDEDELQSWINLWSTKFDPEVKVVGEFKYDGMALSLLYIDGIFSRALTRGDGEYGEDVTKHAAQFVRDRIDAKGMVEVRGEALIKKAWLEFMNTGPDKYANCRNAVAGMLNRDQPNNFTHGISFVPYDIEGADFVFNAYTDKLETLKNLGFSMLSCFLLSPISIQEVFDSITEIRERGDIPFDIDGMVFKINDTAKQAELGETSHSPRWAFAYKFPPTKGECTVVDVVFQVGRTGEIAPVAKITATPLMGVVVTSVSLHNEDRMRERQIAIGNSYEVYRSGDVIPHFGKLIKAVPDARPVVFPTNCPCCQTPIVKRGAAYYCENPHCEAQAVASIAYAVSRDVLDVDGLAEQTIDLMLKAGIVKCAADLYKLEVAEIAKLEGYTEYSAAKLHRAIWNSRDTTMDRFIMSLGILEVGKSTARKLAQRILKHQALFELDTPDKVLELKVPDVGPSTAANIAAYFSNPQKKQDAMDLHARLHIPEMGEIQTIEGVAGKTFVFTGKFPESRDTMENKVLAAGGLVSGSVSAKTDYVVVGERPGSNARKANLLGIEIIDYRVFLSLFITGEP